MRYLTVFALFLVSFKVFSQDYFLKNYSPFNEEIPSPENFLGYGIGEFHTRHDRIVSYFQKLADVSDSAIFIEYGKTYEGRPLTMLCISAPENLKKIEQIRKNHLAQIDNFNFNVARSNPLIINLGYNVHGNEPSSSEAALLTAYTLLASQNPALKGYLKNAVIFIDATINPDGRERHTQWANMYRAENLVSDPEDAEHNENWPRGRTNHYWFDLNRDWLLAVHPESRSKLKWYHQWYPNVITDFHEMGTNSTYFFEPMKTNGSKNPIMPKENYDDLNNLFKNYYVKAMDSIGSLYFTKEVFDGTYPGYGSSYGDLQGGLALLFEQGSSRGHVQKTPFGDLTFAFTIRNQYVTGMATVRAALENKAQLDQYQYDFFQSAIKNAEGDKIKAYSFTMEKDQNRIKSFIDKLLVHKVKVYRNIDKSGFIVPTNQPQYRIVQTFFETYQTYQDSVFYDASAWSLAHFYNIKFKSEKNQIVLGEEIFEAKDIIKIPSVSLSEYAYIIDWDDCNAATALYQLQQKGYTLATSFRQFVVKAKTGTDFHVNYGSLLLAVSKQKDSPEEILKTLKEIQKKYNVNIIPLSSGYSIQGIDIGSNHVRAADLPKALLLIGDGVNSYEAGEIWHHCDQRLNMNLTKVMLSRFKNLDLNKYNSLVLVSGTYMGLDSMDVKKISAWLSQGNTLIAIGTAASWAIKNKLVKEKLVEAPKKDKAQVQRIPFDQADELNGKESLGGAIFRVSLDNTHPLGFGYTAKEITVYKNNTVWLSPSENEYSTISKYKANPHVDGYISPINLNDFMNNAASCVVSQVGRGRVILFADDPVFRGSWYSTDRMFTNALFFGHLINVPGLRTSSEE